MAGFWSLLRSGRRPHRGISPETLPLYLGFFEFVHHVRKRGKALLGSWSYSLQKTPDPNKSEYDAAFRSLEQVVTVLYSALSSR
jgi:hypothetical protein